MNTGYSCVSVLEIIDLIQNQDRHPLFMLAGQERKTVTSPVKRGHREETKSTELGQSIKHYMVKMAALKTY